MDALRTLVGCLANVLAVLCLAPLAEGVLRRLTARLQSRRGPPLLQPYFDLLKLLGKEDLEAGESPWVQRAAGTLVLAAVLAVSCLLPLGGPPPFGGAGDTVLLVSLLTLCGISTLLAGWAAGSTFSLLGSSREMMTMVTLEPMLAVALMVGAVHTGSFDLGRVLHGSVYGAAGFPWSGVLLFLAVSLAFPAFVQRVPFDVAEAETEIMEGAWLEYSGPKLALFKYAQMAKLIVYSGLFVALFVPWGGGLPFPVGWLLFWAKVLVLVGAVTAVAATHARYRIDQALRHFARLLAVAFGALVLACYGL